MAIRSTVAICYCVATINCRTSIPFILNTMASEFIYLCTTAVQALNDIGVIKDSPQPGYEYQLNGSLLAWSWGRRVIQPHGKCSTIFL